MGPTKTTKVSLIFLVLIGLRETEVGVVWSKGRGGLWPLDKICLKNTDAVSEKSKILL